MRKLNRSHNDGHGGVMKIGFAGAGAVGCHYASKLMQAGHQVMLLARGTHLQALQREGLQHESDGVVHRLAVHASDDAMILAECDVIIFSCKMTGLAALLKALQPVLRTAPLLVTLQNGVEAPAMTAEAFPACPVAAGTAFIGVRIERPGYVLHTAAGGVRLAWWQLSQDVDLQVLLACLQQAGVPARLDADARSMLWRKMLWNCGFNAITAITRRYARDVAAGAETRALVRAAMQEAVAVGQCCGADICEEDIRKHIEVTLAMGPVKTSMWQDVEAGAGSEIDYINGYVARKADELELAAPVNTMLTALIHAIEGRDIC